ncbi:MAG: hypothetical protein EOP46_14745 [Sphingobacteriaceae bacterium]|nr:MAG: hypothetical protein EOP46_14745 [Sphingobacteriaceae bacterium]
MSFFKPITLLVIVAAFLFSCKKETKPSSPETVNPIPADKTPLPQDSISFTIQEEKYVFSNIKTAGVGNLAMNIKPFKEVKDIGKLAYETGGYYWYGEPDSTLYSLFFEMLSDDYNNRLSVSFNKKFKDSDLQKGTSLRKLTNNIIMFEPGKLPYAVDIEKENTLEGICIDFSGRRLNLNASTRVPGFSILVRSDLDNNIQSNSTFEITSLKHVRDEIYIIEAKFEANLFDEQENAYRLKNGYMRIKGNMTNFLSPFFL